MNTKNKETLDDINTIIQKMYTVIQHAKECGYNHANKNIYCSDWIWYKFLDKKEHQAIVQLNYNNYTHKLTERAEADFTWLDEFIDFYNKSLNYLNNLKQKESNDPILVLKKLKKVVE